MTVAVGSGFTVSFEGQADAQLATRALESLERASTRIGGVLGIYPLNPIAVVLYTGEQFRDITRAPLWAAGAFDGTIRIPMRGALEHATELDRVLAHEFTHALIHALGPRGVPIWLNEGLAAALEREHPLQPKAPADAPSGQVPLRTLQKSFRALTGIEAQRAYATSAFATQRLIEEAGGVALANLLRDLALGVDFETAFARRMQRSFSDFQTSLTRP